MLVYNSYNVSVMKGCHNFVLSRIKVNQAAVFDLGCICHLANLRDGADIKQFPLPVEDLLVDVYFHVEKSCKRIEICKEFKDST